MAMMKREKFDQHGTFVCVKKFLCGGKELRAGQLFDKGSVDARLLRQLYDTHYIKFTEEAVGRLNDAFDVPDRSKAERVRLKA